MLSKDDDLPDPRLRHGLAASHSRLHSLCRRQLPPEAKELNDLLGASEPSQEHLAAAISGCGGDVKLGGGLP